MKKLFLACLCLMSFICTASAQSKGITIWKDGYDNRYYLEPGDSLVFFDGVAPEDKEDDDEPELTEWEKAVRFLDELEPGVFTASYLDQTYTFIKCQDGTIATCDEVFHHFAALGYDNTGYYVSWNRTGSEYWYGLMSIDYTDREQMYEQTSSLDLRFIHQSEESPAMQVVSVVCGYLAMKSAYDMYNELYPGYFDNDFTLLHQVAGAPADVRAAYNALPCPKDCTWEEMGRSYSSRVPEWRYDYCTTDMYTDKWIIPYDGQSGHVAMTTWSIIPGWPLVPKFAYPRPINIGHTDFLGITIEDISREDALAYMNKVKAEGKYVRVIEEIEGFTFQADSYTLENCAGAGLGEYFTYPTYEVTYHEVFNLLIIKFSCPLIWLV